MERLLTLLALALPLASAAGAQDRASVDRVFAEYDKATVDFDPAWFLAHSDPTLIMRSNGELSTYTTMAAEMNAAKGQHIKSTVLSSVTTVDAATIVGDRAIVDLTSRWEDTSMRPRKQISKCHAILVWKDGTWRMWRLDMTVAPA